MAMIRGRLLRPGRAVSCLGLAFLASLAAYTAQALPGPTSAAFDDEHFSGTGWIKVLKDDLAKPFIIFVR